jgi:hypothetical protein
MGDWENWNPGDWLECVVGAVGAYTEGCKYQFIEISAWETARSVDDKGDENGMPPRNFKWHSRP